MEAKVRNRQDITVIQVGGTLDIEDTQNFKSVVLKKFSAHKLIFNMQRAAFVGSTGIGAFLETLRELSTTSRHGLKLVGVSSDFARVFQNLELANLEIFENEDRAVQSFQLPDVLIEQTKLI